MNNVPKFTKDEKRLMYRRGQYRFSVRGLICTAYWNDEDWIRYIDFAGEWLPLGAELIAENN